MQSVLNLWVDKHLPPPWPPAQDTLLQAAKDWQLPSPCSAMMTAASMKSLGYADIQQQGLRVECWVTSGLSNLRRCGDPTDAPPRAGTINLIVLIHHALTPAALCEAMIIATEAKTTAVRDLNLISPVSGLPASGTGTDSHAILCAMQEPVHSYCGKHTLLGECLGKAVLEACQQSLQHSLPYLLNERC